MRNSYWFILVLLQFSQTSFAKQAGESEMNGIRFSDYKHFQEKWRLLTVRYRVDSAEQRFVWANKLAWDALKKGASFPDGAVFAKIGVITNEDPTFKSSRVPSGALRYQFMVRNRSKYSDTGGWGYALFNAQKIPSSEEPKSLVKSCHACHEIAASKQFVFSEPLKAFQFPERAFFAENSSPKIKDSLQFSDRRIDELPEIVKRNLEATGSVRFLNGNMRKHLFPGTFDELRPSLAQEASTSGKPAILVGEDEKIFSVVYKAKVSDDCKSHSAFTNLFSSRVAAQDGPPVYILAWKDFCSE